MVQGVRSMVYGLGAVAQGLEFWFGVHGWLDVSGYDSGFRVHGLASLPNRGCPNVSLRKGFHDKAPNRVAGFWLPLVGRHTPPEQNRVVPTHTRPAPRENGCLTPVSSPLCVRSENCRKRSSKRHVGF